jgi:thiol-disulfide isomerase/thioredoxin
MTDFGPRTLRQRLVALLGVGAIVGVVLAGLWAAGVFKSTAGEAATLVDTPAVAGVSDVGPLAGQVAPDFELTDFDGNRHRLSDYRGKVVYVNFWATWCVPCKAELPEIYNLQQEYGDRLEVIEVDRGETTDKASAFFKGASRLDGGTGVSFGVNGIDPTEALYKRYETLPIQVTPISIFIDARGIVTTLYNGQLTGDQMHANVEKAVAGDETGG